LDLLLLGDVDRDNPFTPTAG